MITEEKKGEEGEELLSLNVENKIQRNLSVDKVNTMKEERDQARQRLCPTDTFQSVQEVTRKRVMILVKRMDKNCAKK